MCWTRCGVLYLQVIQKLCEVLQGGVFVTGELLADVLVFPLQL